MENEFINTYIDKTNEELFSAIRDKNILKSQIVLLEKRISELLNHVNELEKLNLELTEKNKKKKVSE